jgi:hypothetical protein
MAQRRGGGIWGGVDRGVVELRGWRAVRRTVLSHSRGSRQSGLPVTGSPAGAAVRAVAGEAVVASTAVGSANGRHRTEQVAVGKAA